MGKFEKIANLKAELLKTIKQLDKTFVYYKEFRKDFPQNRGDSKKYDLVTLSAITMVITTIRIEWNIWKKNSCSQFL